MTKVADIESVDDQFFAALNEMFKGNVTPMEALWSHADDVVYLGPSRDLFHVGWDAIDKDWLQQNEAQLGGSIEVVKRHITSSDTLATVHHVAEVSSQGGEDKISMRGTNVFRKESGEWKLIAHHSDPLPYLDIPQ
ncbi:MAG: nuclear transport factor 2 family protein [Pseudomonadota bacterium]